MFTVYLFLHQNFFYCFGVFIANDFIKSFLFLQDPSHPKTQQNYPCSRFSIKISSEESEPSMLPNCANKGIKYCCFLIIPQQGLVPVQYIQSASCIVSQLTMIKILLLNEVEINLTVMNHHHHHKHCDIHHDSQSGKINLQVNSPRIANVFWNIDFASSTQEDWQKSCT